MKRVNPTQRELEHLIGVYREARDNLVKIIVNFDGVGTKVYYNTILKQLETELKRLEKQSAFYVKSAIPREYEKGLQDTYAYFKKNNLQMSKPSMFAQINVDAVHALSREMQYHIGQGIALAGRQVIRYVEDSRDNALRQAGLQASAVKTSMGATVRDMQRDLTERLQSEGFMTVQYGEGKNAYQVSLDSYAAMVSRSTTREANNIARVNQLLDNGYDLVKMSKSYPTCKICAMYQGRVYSLTGKDKRFPALYETAFKSGYQNIHPNCRHSISPWIEELQDKSEIDAKLAEAKKPFEDRRTEAEAGAYSREQSINRRARQDRYQYERYKARLGDNAPKTFSAFMRVKKSDGKEWGKLQHQYIKVGKDNEKAGR